MSEIVQRAQGFFLELDTHRSLELVTQVPIMTMMNLITFGERMKEEAQEHVNEFKLLGRDLEANSINEDVLTIEKNLRSLQKAYNYAMN